MIKHYCCFASDIAVAIFFGRGGGGLNLKSLDQQIIRVFGGVTIID